MAWASGVAGYWRSVCDQITTPVVSEYSAAIREIGSHVIQPLVGFNSDGIAIPAYGEDWATVAAITGDWKGDAGNNAETFYNNFSETVTILGNFTRAVNFGCCSVATLVQGTQQSVDKAVKGMRTAVIAQLDEWRRLGREPDRAPEPPSEMVANITKLGEDVFAIVRDKVPVVGSVVEKVESALTDFEQYKAVGEDLMTVFGVTLEHEEDPEVHLATANEMYTPLTDILYRTNYKEFDAALKKLQPPSSGTGLPTPEEAGGDRAFTGTAIWDAWNNPDWPPFQKNVGRGSLGVTGD